MKPLSRQYSDLYDDIEGTDTAKDLAISPKIESEYELQVVSIDDAPKYNALSYIWGAPEATKPVTVNGQVLLITENLDSALRHIPCADISPAIWIDSICIDQANDVEKTEQVRMMKSIYSNATLVIVWLGLPTPKSDFILDVVESFIDHILSRYSVPTPRKYQLSDYLDFDAESDVWELIQLAIDSSTSKTKKSIARDGFADDFLTFIATREWWYRVWVLQEFVFARQVYLQVGHRRLDLEGVSALFVCILQLQFNSVLEHNFSHQQDIIGQQAGYDWIAYMLSFRERYVRLSNSKASSKVFDLLCTIYFRPWATGNQFFLSASDKRDHIYGLFNLCEEEDSRNLGIAVDYRRGWQDLYCDISQKLIEAGNLEVLSLCQAEKHSILPSWTPIWHEITETPNAWFKSKRQVSVLGNSFDSASKTKLDVSFTVIRSQTPAPRSMRITGIFVDVIMGVESVYAKSRATSPNDRELLLGRLFREIESLCE